MKQGGVGLVVLLLIAMATGCGSGGGNSAPPFTVSEAEVRAECLTGTFVPEGPGFDLLRQKPPARWQVIEGAPHAMQAERGAALVTLRPREAESKVTVTGVKFDVDNLGLRPIGTVFYKPCKRQLKGAVIEGDLDRYGHLHESNRSFDGTLGKGLFVAANGRPISFPWTIALRRPLHLYLAVEAYDIWARWSVRISWESGSSHGVAHIDNDGKKYEIVDGQGTGWYRPGPGGQWDDSGSSRWIGVR